MNRLALAFALLLLTACSSTRSISVGHSQADEAKAVSKDKNLAILIGERSFDKDDYSPLEDQLAFGVEYSVVSPGEFGMELGFALSSDDDRVLGIDVEASSVEIYGGVRRNFGSPGSSVRPYFGAGLALIESELEASSGGVATSDDDISVGTYAHLGITAEVSENVNVGLDLRALFGTDIEVFGFETDADYIQIAIVIGWAL